MEVVLKKTKITSNIIKQTNSASEHDLKTFEVLGWCNYKVGKYNYKYILLYKSATQELRVYLYFRELVDNYSHSYNNTDGKERFLVEIRTTGYNTKHHSFYTEEDRAEFKEVLKRVKHQAEMSGQIYI